MKPKTWRWFSLLVVLSMLLSATGVFAATPLAPVVSGPIEAQGAVANPPDSSDGKTLQLEPVAPTDIVPMTATPGSGEVLYEVKGATEPALYIVQLEGAPLASYRGGVRGLQATSPAVTGESKLDVKSAASQAYLDYLAEQQDQFLTSLQQTLGRSAAVQRTLRHAYNGLIVTLTPEEAAKVAQLPGVLRVVRNYTRYLQTDTSPEYLNAVGIWDGSNTGALPGTMGEGIVAGIIDTGINMDHPSFADVGDDGYDHTNPLGAGTYTGWCDPAHPNYSPSLVCNDKLIGVYSYPSSGGNPEDDNSHGSHTASTTAGNVIFSPTLTVGLTFNQMSGMAPHANIIAYDVCNASGCQGDSILAAINDAVADGVDVINYSIGGGPYDPWADPDSQAYLAARDAGVFVATSAGNDGPGAGTVGSPGNSPWMTTVANGTHDRGFGPNGVVDMQGGTPPADMPGTGVSPEYTARIVYAADYGNALCGLGDQETPTNPFAPGTWDGEIVVCDRGTYYLVDKAANVRAAGAGGVIIANTSATGAQTYTTDLGMPGTHVTSDNADLLRAWLVASNTNVYTATITASPIMHNPAWGDIMNDSSSRGPNVNANVLKPDIMAPGTNILAAYAGDADAFGLMSGTSMASPHVAGAGALMSAVHPDWTPAEVQSALMMTSWTSNLLKEDGVTPADPFDVGAGRLDLTGAALAGLVLNETTTGYADADPAAGGDPTALNIASLANASCLQDCSWDRTFRNTTAGSVVWTVTFAGDVPMAASPVSFTVAAGASQLVEFTADVSALPNDVWVFGTVILTPDDDSLPVQHLPVAVLPTAGLLPDEVVINTRRNAGSQEITGLQTAEIFQLTTESFGLAPMVADEFALGLMATSTDFPAIFYANLPDDAYWSWINVPAGGMRLVAEILDTTSPDLDMLVAFDANANGVMDLEDTVLHDFCQSATGGSWESCDIMAPDAGDWYVIIINFAESVPGVPDAVTLGTAVVPGTDAGNMWIEGPTSVPALEPYDLTVYWDEPTLVAGDRLYGVFSLGSSPGGRVPGDIGYIPVTLYRHEDDVTKEASAEGAFFGDTITYTITVQPNITPANLTYMITDTIPAGLTYVPGSAAATEGVVNVVGNQLTWEGIMYVPTSFYAITTSDEDPLCDTGFGGYVDLQTFGIFPQSGITGDTSAWNAFGGQLPFYFYGVPNTGIYFTDDGFAGFDINNNWVIAPEPWTNQNLPDSTVPNNLIAFLWQDMEIVYDAANNYGVSLANAGTGVSLIEYDDVQVYGDSSQTYDVELVYFNGEPVDDPGYYEFVMAYDNIVGAVDGTTIGVESPDGTEASLYAYNDAGINLHDGLMICYDWVVPTTDPVTITYQVTVDENAEVSPLTNEVLHNTDNPGSKQAETWWDLYLLGDGFKDVSATLINPGELVTYTIVLTAGPELEMWNLTDPLPDGLSLVSVDGAAYDPGTHSISWSGVLGTGQYTPTESFEGTFPPAGWTLNAASGVNWVQTTSRYYTGAYSAYHDDTSGGQDAWLITPQFPGGGTFSFWQNQNYSTWYVYHGLWISTTDSNPASFTELVNLGAGTEDTWEEIPVDLSAYAGQDIYLAFRYQGDFSDEWYIDDVTFPPVNLESSHTITIVMEGVVPGYYTNVATAEIGGLPIALEAPELRVYGPEPTWEKEVWINAEGPFAPGAFDVVPGDSVTIVDHVSVSFSGPITFTLTEAWDDLVGLQAYEADFGTVTPGASMLTWDVESGIGDTWYTLTKTFEVIEGFGWSGIITETLAVEGYPTPLEVPVMLNIAALLEKTGVPTAYSGDTVPYAITLDFNPLAGLAELEDILPAGLEYVPGTLTATFGTAWYDSGVIYWNNAAGRSANAPVVADGLLRTVKGDGVAAPRAPLPVATPKGDLLAESFEAGVMPPSGWSVVNTSANNWTLVDTTNNDPGWIHSGVYAGWVNYLAADQDEWLISPLVNLAGQINPAVSFWVYCNNNWPTAGLEFIVQDPEGLFEDTLWRQLDQSYPYPSTYYNVVVDLSAYNEPVYLAWRYVGNDGDSIALDDILVYADDVYNVTINFDALVTAAPGTIITNTAELTYMGTVQESDAVLEVLPWPTADYSHLSAYGDAWHTPDHTLWLGTAVTDESAPPDPDGAADDGVVRTMSELWLPGATVNLTATVTGPAGGYLAAWFDWNGDGDFDDAGELGFQNIVSTGANPLAITIPGDYATGDPVNARFRLYPGNGFQPTPTGGAANGEVEDYTWLFSPTAVTLTALAAGSGMLWSGLALLGVFGLGIVVWRRKQR
ncbi:MAG: S8 family serine peptidase [Anaerolineae bacterium]|nr:S8 family serine peptidase [Anaerolineae bacterium]